LIEAEAGRRGLSRSEFERIEIDAKCRPVSDNVSVAAWCAGQQGRFWEFHDAVYADASTDATDSVLAKYATAAGLDASRLATWMNGPGGQHAVQRDASEGESVGVRSTPAFFVNGREVHGAQPLEVFERIIDEELRRQLEPGSSAPEVPLGRMEER
jgi:protein-disulfide isomerase